MLESKIEMLTGKLGIKKFRLYVHPFVAAYLNQGMISLKRRWQMKYGMGVRVYADQKLAFLQYVFQDSHGEEISMAEEHDLK